MYKYQGSKEDIAEQWLNEHDPTPKRQKTYLSNRQMARREDRERPVSSLNKKARQAINHIFYGDRCE